MSERIGPRISRRHALQAAAVATTALIAHAGPVAGAPPDAAAIKLIPAPRSAQSTGSNAPCIISSTSGVVANDPSLQSIADWLREQTASLASISLSGGTGTGRTIELEIDPDMSSDHPTSGVRADGEEPERELYALDISREGIRISARTDEGVFRGATSLLHLITDAAVDGEATLDACSIVDAPRFAWRGLSFDVVRTFHPVETVKRVIDLLALYKLNVLHLHLTDTEGWRFEVPEYPKLTDVSGKTASGDRPGGYYSQADYESILEHASARFVTIVPEFDSPGHTASIFRAYPELATEEILDTPESMHYLHPDIPGVWDLVGAVYDELARVHPGARIHVGGDEALAMDDDTFSAYMDTALPMARATGKGIVAWQEASRAGLSEGDLMQHWIPPHLVNRVRSAIEEPGESWLDRSFPDPDVREAFVRLFIEAPYDLLKALEGGADVIISRADRLYLDTSYPEPSSDPDQEEDHERVGLPTSVYGNGTVQDAYDWDPLTIEPYLPANRIAGIEGAIWCETIEDERDLMFQLLPRLPGVAEKGWSDLREWEDYKPRLALQRRIWDAMGVNYFASSVVWPNENSATAVASPAATPQE